ncbi:hypothetical protein HPP92_021846 [Vanilla planifolia]|uniref:Uncharacterized protein n=1 Tax=Vanilla planifolia TaxID=51239 RepID=A0A835Q1Y1_VANPL|nr:hypothetical protein HPP92_021846 [Vanilla planifolia]
MRAELRQRKARGHLSSPALFKQKQQAQPKAILPDSTHGYGEDDATFAAVVSNLRSPGGSADSRVSAAPMWKGGSADCRRRGGRNHTDGDSASHRFSGVIHYDGEGRMMGGLGQSPLKAFLPLYFYREPGKRRDDESFLRYTWSNRLFDFGLKVAIKVKRPPAEFTPLLATPASKKNRKRK